MKQSITKGLSVTILSLALSFFQSCTKSNEPIPQQVTNNDLTVNAYNTLIPDSSGVFVSTLFNLSPVFVSSIARAADGTLYVTSYPGDKVYKVSTTGGVSTIVQGVNSPAGIKVAINGDVYFTSYFDNKIFKYSVAGVLSQVITGLSLSRPTDLAMADDGTLYIADSWHKRILKMTSDGKTSVLAGKPDAYGIVDGKGANAHFNYVTSLKLGSDGYLWAVDGDDKGGSGLCVRRITLQGVVTTPLKLTTNRRIYDLCPAKTDSQFKASNNGNVFILYNDNEITHFNPNTQTETSITSTERGNIDGPIASARFSSPHALSFRNNSLYVNDNNIIRKIYRK